MFTTKTAVEFSEDNRYTIMELVAGDRPGLLSDVGRVFIELGIDINTAKILTIGERAEDVFYLCDETGKPLDSTRCEALRERLVERLERSA